MRIVPTSLGIALALAFAAPAAAQISPAFDYTTSSTLPEDRPFTLGFAFSLRRDTINGLGYGPRKLSSHRSEWSSSGTCSLGHVSPRSLLGDYRYEASPRALGPELGQRGQYFNGFFQ